jgi:hypothetical protein
MGRFTLQEYIIIENNVNYAIDELLSESGFSNSFQDFFDQFKRNLVQVIRNYTLRLYQLGQEHGYQKQTAEPSPEVTLKQTAEPSPEVTPKQTAEPSPEVTPKQTKKEKQKSTLISPQEDLNPLQSLLRPRTRNKLDPKKLTSDNLSKALKYLHKHEVDITSPIDVVHAMENMASEKYKDRGDFLRLYGKSVGIDVENEGAILAKLGIKKIKKIDSSHASPEEIEKEIERLRGEEKDSGYDFLGTEGEPENYLQDEPEEEKFN